METNMVKLSFTWKTSYNLVTLWNEEYIADFERRN